MGRIRSFRQLANCGFSNRFHLCQRIKSSSPCLHLVAIDASNLVHGSNIHGCRKSYTVSASSDALEAKKIQRRVSKDERKSMMENYVNRYREMNAGKFPTATDVRKNVGGSHYSVRKVLQELIYYSERPLETKDSVSLGKSSMKKDEICTDFGEAFQRKKLEHIGPISKVDMREDGSNSVKSKEGLQSSISSKGDIAKYDGPQSHRLGNEPKSSLQSDPENNIKHKTVHEDKLYLDGLQPKSKLEQSTESDVSGRDSPKTLTEDAEAPRKSSVWQNLRSFANGILGIWKRS